MFRLLELRVFAVAAIPTFVRYDAFPLPIALKPSVSAEAFLDFWTAAADGGLYDVTVLRFQFYDDWTVLV